MKWKIALMSAAAASLIAGTTGAFAVDYSTGQAGEWKAGPPGSPSSEAVPRGSMYYHAPARWGSLNGANHPTPYSTQGDVGPEGNNNGTLTGRYRYW